MAFSIFTACEEVEEEEVVVWWRRRFSIFTACPTIHVSMCVCMRRRIHVI